MLGLGVRVGTESWKAKMRRSSDDVPPELSNVPPQALEVSRRVLPVLPKSSLARGLLLHIRDL